ncbi:DNA-binding NarL/FixJ family response regulator [Paucibacter oligotrophus]|uniref:DNA-binding NarL/FixJ family response regulator n=1 Tax=Roseateles oligotrophus TaxID=1769250 RepID=A0A840L0S1_9BURK|nr:response regulator transcription factor [Roseateles oligotrophus]MBB4841840.1 DNA-binding NarL/FixJ family response regulator [Roseateles oligotrophus]
MKVLLIDDHAMFREGIALLLRPLVAELQISEAGSCEQALALLAELGAVDLVLMDLGLPGISGVEGIALLRERFPETPVVALSSSDDKATVLRALDAGAMGFIPKSANSAILIQALRLVMAKGIYLPPSVFLGGRDSGPAEAAASAPASEKKSLQTLGLSPRQIEVLYLLLQGKSAKLICRELDLSASTVKAHTSSVLRALNVTTRTQAVVAASRLGLRFD